MEQERDVLAVKDARKFEVHCNAGDAGELCVGTESLSVKVGQRIHRDGVEEIWHSLLIHCDTVEDGSPKHPTGTITPVPVVFSVICLGTISLRNQMSIY